MLIRVGIQLQLKRRLAGRSPVPWALIVAALAFWSMHLPNVLLGQPPWLTIVQAGVATVLGRVICYYFQRTENYLGAALLHNAFNAAGVIGNRAAEASMQSRTLRVPRVALECERGGASGGPRGCEVAGSGSHALSP